MSIPVEDTDLNATDGTITNPIGNPGPVSCFCTGRNKCLKRQNSLCTEESGQLSGVEGLHLYDIDEDSNIRSTGRCMQNRRLKTSKRVTQEAARPSGLKNSASLNEHPSTCRVDSSGSRKDDDQILQATTPRGWLHSLLPA